MFRRANSIDDCLTSSDLSWYIHCGDVLELLESLPAQSLDLVFGSPPI